MPLSNFTVTGERVALLENEIKLSNRISYFLVTHLLIAIQFLVELLGKFVFSFTPFLAAMVLRHIWKASLYLCAPLSFI